MYNQLLDPVDSSWLENVCLFSITTAADLVVPHSFLPTFPKSCCFFSHSILLSICPYYQNTQIWSCFLSCSGSLDDSLLPQNRFQSLALPSVPFPEPWALVRFASSGPSNPIHFVFFPAVLPLARICPFLAPSGNWYKVSEPRLQWVRGEWHQPKLGRGSICRSQALVD